MPIDKNISSKMSSKTAISRAELRENCLVAGVVFPAGEVRDGWSNSGMTFFLPSLSPHCLELRE